MSKTILTSFRTSSPVGTRSEGPAPVTWEFVRGQSFIYFSQKSRIQSAPMHHSMPTIRVDASFACQISEGYNLVVQTILTPGIGRAACSSRDLQLGLSVLPEIFEKRRMFFLGNRCSRRFSTIPATPPEIPVGSNCPVFQAVPRQKPGFPAVNVQIDWPNHWPNPGYSLEAPFAQSTPLKSPGRRIPKSRNIVTRPV
jgi:hypothetical protein